ncbi:MAG: hypothetical protein QOE29_1079 [Gaiellaceae bacterium]|nr:hypothetical protein [Gaiellaceae bacterium]
MRRALVAGVASLALLLGVAAIALGLAVHAVPAALQREDAALADVEPDLTLGRPVSTRIARALVGAPDRRPYLEVLRRYADATGAAGLGNAFGDVDTLQGQHGANELQIAGLLGRLHEPRQRSQAATMLGTLILLYSSNGKAAGGAQLVQQAAGDFQEAILADPANDAAKYDLELLLRLHAASDRQQTVAKPDKPKANGHGSRPVQVTGNDY